MSSMSESILPELDKRSQVCNLSKWSVGKLKKKEIKRNACVFNYE